MIDWARVRVLQDEVGNDDFSDIVDIFLTEVQQIADKLHAPQTGDNLESDLHALKNCALNLGFSDLSALCQTAEKQAAAGAKNQINLANVLEVYKMSRSAFLSELSRETAV